MVSNFIGDPEYLNLKTKLWRVTFLMYLISFWLSSIEMESQTALLFQSSPKHKSGTFKSAMRAISGYLMFYFSLFDWIRRYEKSWILRDVVSGITTGVMVNFSTSIFFTQEPYLGHPTRNCIFIAGWTPSHMGFKHCIGWACCLLPIWFIDTTGDRTSDCDEFLDHRFGHQNYPVDHFLQWFDLSVDWTLSHRLRCSDHFSHSDSWFHKRGGVYSHRWPTEDFVWDNFGHECVDSCLGIDRFFFKPESHKLLHIRNRRRLTIHISALQFCHRKKISTHQSICNSGHASRLDNSQLAIRITR